MRVLVTGHRGYIGPWVVRLFKDAGHEVVGVDVGLFEGCAFEPLPYADAEWSRDFRDLSVRDLASFDAIVHLAAISNDPMGELDPGLTRAVNLEGSVALAECARDAGVSRFLFSGSCSVYGKGGDDAPADESSPVQPLSVYAESKVLAETRIGALAQPGFSPVFLRNATAFGHSPMLRIDLVVNNLLACAVARGEIRIHSDGSPWRPLIHCRDIAAALLAIAEAPVELTHGLAINVGDDGQNYRVKDVADVVGNLVPTARVIYTGEAVDDPRDYRVSFSRLRRLLPAFAPLYDLRTGAEDLLRRLQQRGFRQTDFDSPRYVRLRTLQRRGEVAELRYEKSSV